MTTKENTWKKKLLIKSDLGKKFFSEYYLCNKICKENNESQWKKRVKGMKKLKWLQKTDQGFKFD